MKPSLPRLRRVALVVASVVLLAACARQVAPPTPGPDEPDIAAAAATDLFISEYVEGSSDNKAIEVYNGTGEPVALGAGGYAIQMYFNGSSTSTLTINLSGTVADGGVHVLAHANANPAILAQADQTDGAGWFNGDDAVVLSKNGTPIDVIGQIGVDPGSEWGTGDTSTSENTLRRKDTVVAGDPDGTDAFDPTVEWDGFPQNTVDGLGCHLDCPEEPEPEIGVCGDPATLVHEIQGAGPATPLLGQTVAIEGVVVGDFQTGDGDPFGTNLDGFFVQEEEADADADPATSEGIFVDAPGAADVQEGDLVRVEGDAEEFFGMTQVSNVNLVVCDSGPPLPTAAVIAFPLTSVDDLEAFEGMYVTFPQTLFISEFFNFDRFGEIVLAGPIDPFGRPYQPTSYVEPADAPTQAEKIALNRITLDDGRGNQNPDPARHPNGDVFDLNNRFRGGDTVTNVTGVLDYSFGAYKIQPTEGADYEATNPRPAAPDTVGGSVTAASLNVLNYFSTLDSGGAMCGPLGRQECRGANDATEFERQRDKIFAALEGLDADIVGLVEIENDAGDAALLDLVGGLNQHLGSTVYAAIETGPIGPDAIRVALIYKPATVTPVGDFAVLASPEFLDPNDTGEAKNRPALAQTFAPAGGGDAVTIVVNHFKSKGSACGAGDDDGPQGNCNLTRTLAAQELLDWIATDPTGSGDPDVLLVGDYNAYDKEDPIDVLLAAGYGDLLFDYVGEDAYTYVFDGQLGYLDYAIANSVLAGRVTGVTAWAINADEPDLLDYDTSFKQPAQDALYEPNAFRSSDHDPVLVGLDLNRAPVCSGAESAIGRLWPANHQLVAGSIAGVTDPDGDPVTIAIDRIYQDEPVDADDDGNTMPDAVIGLGNAFEVRAERDGEGNGRVYHVTFTASDGAASCTGTVQIDVDVNRGRNGAAVDDGPLFDATAH